MYKSEHLIIFFLLQLTYYANELNEILEGCTNLIFFFKLQGYFFINLLKIYGKRKYYFYNLFSYKESATPY